MLHADTPKIETLPRQAQLWSHGVRMNGTAKPPVNRVCLYFTFPFSILKAKTKGKKLSPSPQVHYGNTQCIWSVHTNHTS